MKTGYAILVCDHGIPERANKLEMLPGIYDSHASIDIYKSRFLNEKVTKIVQIVPVEVEDHYNLVCFTNR